MRTPVIPAEASRFAFSWKNARVASGSVMASVPARDTASEG